MIESLSLVSWVFICASILFVGLAKAGLAGAGTVSIPILALILGGKISVGFLLPILLLADSIAVIYYRQTAQWHILIKILPSTFAGIILGTFIGNSINEKQFHILLVIIILIGVGITLWRQFVSTNAKIPKNPYLLTTVGLVAGISSMIGNASGPIMSIFLLAMNLSKKEFAGTYAWFFFISNISKVPFHIWVWHTITPQSLQFGILVIPAVILGMFLGFKIVKKVSEKTYKIIIISLTFLTAMFLLLK